MAQIEIFRQFYRTAVVLRLAWVMRSSEARVVTDIKTRS